MLTTVLFDLDGTLLPMDQDVFVNSYFGNLCRKMAAYGYEPERLVKNIWKGTAVMVRNDGSVTNEEAFWNFFAGEYGEASRDHIPIFDDFYHNEFQAARSSCGFTPRAKQVIQLVKDLGLRVILATNPIFPAVATESRIRWAGFQPEMFEYYTTYENSCTSKPNPAYYREILRKCGLQAEECIMVGNDTGEDMIAESLGMRVFLLTDCLIDRTGDLSRWPHGSFDELEQYLKTAAKEQSDV